MSEKIKVLDIKGSGQSERLKILSIQYLDRNGKEKVWDIVTRNSVDVVREEIFNKKRNVDGIAICAIHKPTNKLVLLKEFRIHPNSYIFNLPGGMVREGEVPEEVAKREFFEETGLELFKIDKIGKPRYSAIGITNEKIIIVYGECRGDVSIIHQSDSEDANVIMVDETAAQEIIDNEEIASKTELVLENFILQRKIEREKADIDEFSNVYFSK
ncbi:NUDIX hydrolase [Alkaliphilus sp. B6464]|uniref:NUDIX hydrolase n=1 Tax=Alkaliphilus sp. B6464 TaxID=2731219 RepID=UPI001BA8C77D|nr:NUDIX hydrolase [Alkaliphilus sp. B6464]QUH21780.1 NUDIX hydrolase [Alkaliphilus sp. B6464]